LESLGDTDDNHLQNATQMGRVFCTHDQDFLRIAAETVEHAGIIYAEKYNATIGGWVKQVQEIYNTIEAEDMIGQVRFIKVK
jgi:hypothetical protein